MTFHDLPPDWPTISLTERRHDTVYIADLLDLIVNMQARLARSLMILVCDGDGLPLQPILLEEITTLPDLEAQMMMRRVVDTIMDQTPGSAALCAVARPGTLRLRAGDLAWSACLSESMRTRMPILGTHLVTPVGSRSICSKAQAA